MSRQPPKTPGRSRSRKTPAEGASQVPPAAAWQCPPPEDESPEARRLVEAILANPTYRQADEDVDFLTRDECRPVRLHLDYLKTELELRRLGVTGTIVVFGGARVCESAVVERRIARLKRALLKRPGDGQLGRLLRVQKRLLEKGRYYDMARELGRLVGASGKGPKDNRLVIATGGGPGIMEAANRGAYDVGANSVGLNITLPEEQRPNPYITPKLCFRFHYFAIRKLHFLLRAKALVAFPGGYGSFDELFEALTLVQTRTIRPVPVVLVGESFWRKAFDVEFLADEGVIAPEDRELFWFAGSAEEAWEGILRWHQATGTPLF